MSNGIEPEFPATIVLRHKKENLKKCSLRGLEQREDFQFFTYPKDVIPDFQGYILLDFNGPLLSEDDADSGLFILDGTWNYAKKMYDNTPGTTSLKKRSLPNSFVTAYPRKQEDCPDPSRGLASVEAIFIAYHILGRDTSGLLNGYHWKKEFLEMNGFSE